MNKQTYKFYIIPKVVFCNANLSPCSKLLFAYLVSREAFFVSKKGYSQGSFFHCYLSTIANQIGKSTDSVRKNYIPELIAAGFVEKRNRTLNRKTHCEFRILWESIDNSKADEIDIK